MGTLLVLILWLAVNVAIEIFQEDKKEKRRKKKHPSPAAAPVVRQVNPKNGYDWELRESA